MLALQYSPLAAQPLHIATGHSPVTGGSPPTAAALPIALRIPELLSLVLSSLPVSALSPRLLCVHSTFYAALLPLLWRKVKLGEVPALGRFCCALNSISPVGGGGAEWVYELDLRVTSAVIERTWLLDALGLELADGRFPRLRKLKLLCATRSTDDFVATRFLADVSRGVGEQLEALEMDGSFPASAVVGLVDGAPGLRSLALQVSTLAGAFPPLAPIPSTLRHLVVLPSLKFPSPSIMIHPHWPELLITADIVLLAAWLDALQLLRADPATSSTSGRIKVDLTALWALGVGQAEGYALLREREKGLKETGVDLHGLPAANTFV